ncbi:MAG: hypothetical protein OXG67_17575 [bacterium]|nr:hypothetical protein [bacterium]MCY3889926.1 hypothetical protein [bacterium]
MLDAIHFKHDRCRPRRAEEEVAPAFALNFGINPGSGREQVKRCLRDQPHRRPRSTFFDQINKLLLFF